MGPSVRSGRIEEIEHCGIPSAHQRMCDEVTGFVIQAYLTPRSEHTCQQGPTSPSQEFVFPHEEGMIKNTYVPRTE